MEISLRKEIKNKRESINRMFGFGKGTSMKRIEIKRHRLIRFDRSNLFLEGLCGIVRLIF